MKEHSSVLVMLFAPCKYKLLNSVHSKILVHPPSSGNTRRRFFLNVQANMDGQFLCGCDVTCQSKELVRVLMVYRKLKLTD